MATPPLERPLTRGSSDVLTVQVHVHDCETTAAIPPVACLQGMKRALRRLFGLVRATGVFVLYLYLHISHSAISRPCVSIFRPSERIVLRDVVNRLIPDSASEYILALCYGGLIRTFLSATSICDQYRRSVSTTLNKLSLSPLRSVMPIESRKVALVTGCSEPHSLGAALSLDLLRRGFRVFATARRIKTLAPLQAKGCDVGSVPSPRLSKVFES